LLPICISFPAHADPRSSIKIETAIPTQQHIAAKAFHLPSSLSIARLLFWVSLHKRRRGSAGVSGSHLHHDKIIAVGLGVAALMIAPECDLGAGRNRFLVDLPGLMLVMVVAASM
jgi:hypothetical protein